MLASGESGGYMRSMEQLSLNDYVAAAYLIASVCVAALIVASVLRARKAKRNLADLEREEA
jgi:heme exporter protein CcmD